MVYFGFSQKKIHSIVYSIQKKKIHSIVYIKNFLRIKIHLLKLLIYYMKKGKIQAGFFSIQDNGYPTIKSKMDRINSNNLIFDYHSN